MTANALCGFCVPAVEQQCLSLEAHSAPVLFGGVDKALHGLGKRLRIAFAEEVGELLCILSPFHRPAGEQGGQLPGIFVDRFRPRLQQKAVGGFQGAGGLADDQVRAGFEPQGGWGQGRGIRFRQAQAVGAEFGEPESAQSVPTRQPFQIVRSPVPPRPTVSKYFFSSLIIQIPHPRISASTHSVISRRTYFVNLETSSQLKRMNHRKHISHRSSWVVFVCYEKVRKKTSPITMPPAGKPRIETVSDFVSFVPEPHACTNPPYYRKSSKNCRPDGHVGPPSGQTDCTPPGCSVILRIFRS